MDRIIRLMNTPWRRGARIVLGLALVGPGVRLGGTPAGIALLAVGPVPLAMGLWGRCLAEAIAPPHAACHMPLTMEKSPVRETTRGVEELRGDHYD